ALAAVLTGAAALGGGAGALPLAGVHALAVNLVRIGAKRGQRCTRAKKTGRHRGDDRTLVGHGNLLAAVGPSSGGPFTLKSGTSPPFRTPAPCPGCGSVGVRR